jgi:hypothetical protein
MKIMTVAAAAATRATSLALQQQPRFVYKLGNSLYVPLTSRCNSLTLPQLRGDGFVLPTPVVAALCKVRDAELCNHHEVTDVGVGDMKWYNDPNCKFDDLPLKMKLSPPPFEAVASLPTWKYEGGAVSESSQVQLEPKLGDLLRDIQYEFREETNNNIESIVIAGEGEPTLRLEDTIELVRRINKSLLASQARTLPPAIRLTTNGLVVSESSAPGVSSVPQLLWDSGVSRISVGLMTWNATQYQDLVKPVVCVVSESTDGETTTGFDIMCNFVRDAVRVDGELEVELTAVDRPDVDKTKTEALAESLGVTTSVRWRPYFS